MGLDSVGGGSSTRRRKGGGRSLLLLLLSTLLLLWGAEASPPSRNEEKVDRQLRRRRKGEGRGDKAQAAPSHRDESPDVHGASGMALGESQEVPASFTLQTDCGRIRSGPFLHFQDRDLEEREIAGQVTTVVPFYGIPYAAPFLSTEQRWRPPQPAPCPLLPRPTAPAKDMKKNSSMEGRGEGDGVYDASAYEGPCVQADGSGSEDCLYLNIFTPLATLRALEAQQAPALQQKKAQQPQWSHRHHHHHRYHKHHGNGTGGDKANGGGDLPAAGAGGLLLPVVVYIHGGGLMTGMAKGVPIAAIAGDPRFGPVVTVSFDHRLNVFGFLALRELSEEQEGASGNYGLMDQVAALAWVQKHIRAFGGDPQRVTLVGHSSGGTSILALLGSPLAKGLFHRAISLSGSPNITISLADAEIQNSGVMQGSSCGHYNTTAGRLKCLRALPIPTLLGLMPHNWSTPGLWDLPTTPKGQPYGGLPVVDGRVVILPFLEALDAGTIDVPFLLGNTGHEADCCTPRDIRNTSVSDWMSLLKQQFLPWGQGGWLGERIASFYLPEARTDPQKALTAFMADFGLVCGASEAARRAAHSPHFTSPVYAYLNLWGPSTPIPRGDKQDTPMQYAFHGWDLASWLRDYPQGYTPTALDLQHSRLLRQAFYQFAVNGHLNGPPPPGAWPLGWEPVDAVAGWPRSLGIYVIQPPSAAGQGNETVAQEAGGSGMVPDYKADVCEFYKAHGLWQPFWWAD